MQNFLRLQERKFQEKKRIKLIKYFTKNKFLREILLKSGIGFDQGRIQGGRGTFAP